MCRETGWRNYGLTRVSGLIYSVGTHPLGGEGGGYRWLNTFRRRLTEQRPPRLQDIGG